MTKFEETIEHITNLPILEKLRIWNYYMVDTYRLKYHTWYESFTENHYLWNNESPVPFEDWTDITKCKRVIDNGVNWEKTGCAQRIRTDYFGIYDYYFKFILN